MTSTTAAGPTSQGPDAGQVKPQGRLSSWVGLLRGQVMLVAVGALVLLFGLVMGLVLDANLQPTWWDIRLTHEIQEFPGPVGSLLLWVSEPGFAPWNWLSPIVTVLALLAFRWRVEAMFLALASVGGFSAELVKHLVLRPRPLPEFADISFPLHTPSFPSGHVTGYVTFFGFAFYLAYTLLPRNNPLRWLVLIVCGLLVALVGPSRVYMGQHWASDALAGYFLGFAWLLLSIQLHRAWLRRQALKVVALPESSP
ncbi:MAG TPA: phosphatase PAP2 family protein [Chloroflexia bacterium]|nr:phosphatase PAP2 family protein [Chloroflexia bacterium]